MREAETQRAAQAAAEAARQRAELQARIKAQQDAQQAQIEANRQRQEQQRAASAAQADSTSRNLTPNPGLTHDPLGIARRSYPSGSNSFASNPPPTGGDPNRVDSADPIHPPPIPPGQSGHWTYVPPVTEIETVPNHSSDGGYHTEMREISSGYWQFQPDAGGPGNDRGTGNVGGASGWSNPAGGIGGLNPNVDVAPRPDFQRMRGSLNDLGALASMKSNGSNGGAANGIGPIPGGADKLDWPFDYPNITTGPDGQKQYSAYVGGKLVKTNTYDPSVAYYDASGMPVGRDGLVVEYPSLQERTGAINYKDPGDSRALANLFRRPYEGDLKALDDARRQSELSVDEIFAKNAADAAWAQEATQSGRPLSTDEQLRLFNFKNPDPQGDQLIEWSKLAGKALGEKLNQLPDDDAMSSTSGKSGGPDTAQQPKHPSLVDQTSAEDKAELNQVLSKGLHPADK